MLPFRRAARAAAAAFCAVIVFAGDAPAPAPSGADWRRAAPAPVKRGDLVFRRGDGLWTQWFVDASTREKKYSHVGIAASDGANPWIIHAEADDSGADGSVKRQRWSVFMSGAFAAAAYRISDDPELREKIAKCAEKRLGMPFDPSFSLDDTNRLYCTQFVRDAVNEAAGRELVGKTTRNGASIVAIDDCSRGFEKLFEAGKIPDGRKGFFR